MAENGEQKKSFFQYLMNEQSYPKKLNMKNAPYKTLHKKDLSTFL
jgi:hypothetical protein